MISILTPETCKTQGATTRKQFQTWGKGGRPIRQHYIEAPFALASEGL